MAATGLALAAAGSWASAASWSNIDTTLAPVASVSVTVSGTTATVTWKPVTEPVPVSYVIEPFDTFAGALGTRSCTGCTSIVWPGLRPGLSYSFTVAAYDMKGRSPGTNSPVVTTADPLCATPASGHVCVGVSTAASLGAETHPGSGFLHSITKSTSTTAIASLHPTSWRVAALNPDNTPAFNSGANLTLVLSDAWNAATYSSSRGSGISPWEDWARYRAWVVQTVQIEEYYGLSNAYYEIQNEPETKGSYNAKSPPTTALVLQQLAVAYAAIKSVDPNAKIVGPGIGWQWSEPTFPVDMQRFLDYAVANNLRFDALSWHENGDGGPDGRPEAIVDHVATVRAYLAQHPSLGSPAILVDEFGGKAAGLVPGWLTSYLAAFDTAAVAQANHSCFASCFTDPGTLDGVLLSNGASTAASGVVLAQYAAMTGQRLAWVSSSDRVNAVATRDAAGVTHLLVGRDEQCPSWIVSGCPTNYAKPAAQTVDLTLSGLSGTSVQVHTTLIRATTGAMSAPAEAGTQTATVSGGVAHVSLPALDDGAVLVVTATPTS